MIEILPMVAAVAGLEPQSAAKIAAARVALMAEPPFTLRSHLLMTRKMSPAIPDWDKISAMKMKRGAIIRLMLVAWL